MNQKARWELLLIVLMISTMGFAYFNGLNNATRDANTESTWDLTDTNGAPIWGTNIRVAVIDSGIDWQHPSFYFPSSTYDKSLYTVKISPPNDPYIDLDKDNIMDSNEGLNFTREELAFPNGTVFAYPDVFEEGLDFLYIDSNANGQVDSGETMLLFNDTDQSNTITASDKLLPLTEPKIEKIWDRGNLFIRGINLTSPVINTENDTIGHGTHVAGILAGGYPNLTRFTGVAPNATLLVAKVVNDTTGGYIESEVLSAIDWAVKEGADIISLSFSFLDNATLDGLYRDGSDLLDQKIDWAKQQGAIVVVAAGNYADKDTHAQDTFTANTLNNVDWEFDWTTDDPPIDEIRFTVLWRYPHHDATFSLLMHDNTVIASVPKDGSTFQFTDANFVADSYLVTGRQINGTRGTMKQQIRIQKLSGQFQDHDTKTFAGNNPLAILGMNDSGHSVVFRNATAQEYHFYLSNSMIDNDWAFTRFNNPLQISPNYTITVPATSDSAIAVGAHISAQDPNLPFIQILGNITRFSSRGPRIDGDLRPYLSAPGEYLFSTKSQDEQLPIFPLYYYFEHKSGTSMATPMVAGAIALLLQMNPKLTYDQILALLRTTTDQDGFVLSLGNVPNQVFGYGKLDVANLVLNGMPPRVVWTSIPTTFTSGSSILLMANVSDISGVSTVLYNYSTDLGVTWMTLKASRSGPVTKGIWDATIPTVSASTIYVKIWANDSYDIVMDDPTIYVITSTTTTTTTTTTAPSSTSATTTPPTTTPPPTSTTTSPSTSTTTTTTTTTPTSTLTPGFTFAIITGILVISAIVIGRDRRRK
ncbi:MAG: S8 family serine peptidase [Candidatus Heimdallarchaeota archaeon]